MNKRMIAIQISLLFQYIGLIMIQIRHNISKVYFWSCFQSLTCSSFKVFHISSSRCYICHGKKPECDYTLKYHNDFPISKGFGRMQVKKHLVLTLYRHSGVP